MKGNSTYSSATKLLHCCLVKMMSHARQSSGCQKWKRHQVEPWPSGVICEPKVLAQRGALGSHSNKSSHKNVAAACISKCVAMQQCPELKKCFGQLARLRKLKDILPVAVKQKI